MSRLAAVVHGLPLFNNNNNKVVWKMHDLHIADDTLELSWGLQAAGNNKNRQCVG
jgi:hypothetical protein